MNKETILKEYKEIIQKRDDLLILLSNFDTNTEFSHPSYDLLILLDQSLNQELKILEMIALNEKIYEIYEIQREYFCKLASTSEG